jgi:hypothetical protein
LREAIRVLNQKCSELGVEKNPDKTFIGRIRDLIILFKKQKASILIHATGFPFLNQKGPRIETLLLINLLEAIPSPIYKISYRSVISTSLCVTFYNRLIEKIFITRGYTKP